LRAAQASEELALQSLVSIPLWVLLASSAALAAAVLAVCLIARRHKRLERALHQSEERFRDFAEAAADWFWACDADWRITRLEGLEPHSLSDPVDSIGKTPLEAAGVTEPDGNWRRHMAVIARREPFHDFQCSLLTANGELRWASISGKPVFDEKGAFQGYRGSGRDITAEREKRELFVYVMENLSEGVSLWDRDDRFVVCNSAYRKLAGKAAEILAPGVTFRDIVTHFARSGESNIPEGEVEAWIEHRMALHRNMDAPIELRRGDHWYAVNEQILADGSVVVRLTDITQQMQSEERLLQSQRLETVGKLTGGVAHDFNNLLAIILGHLDVVVEDLPPDHPHRRMLKSAIGAAERGATLTQRLLAFSRRQTLAPKTIDANELIHSMEDLLRRSLGEQVQIEVVPSAGLWLCDVDPSQLENALLNLAINARDAMPGGGGLSIESQNVLLDDDYVANVPELEPGPHVMIAVTDTGEGMPEDVLQHIYEPFFTTKGVGKGSGLGLSMVYGFVKQSGGHITVHSEPGLGTTFKIYLPRSRTCAAARQKDNDKLHVSEGRRERILLVEDDLELRDLTVRLLGDLGYSVTSAEHGLDAIAAFESNPGFDLLLTDVVLPGPLNGGALAKELTRRNARLKVLYMSGYAANTLRDGRNLDGSAVLLQKPFRRQDLARKVRQVLDQPAVH